MKKIFTVWTNKKEVNIIINTALLYLVCLVPLKSFPLVIGITEIRPANVLPVVLGIIFGPAAAWGSAIGNLGADIFGTLTWGSIFGFFGNFLFAYVSYLIWQKMKKEENKFSWHELGVYALSAIAASFTCALTISAGVAWLGLANFNNLFGIIFLNNFIAAIVIGPMILKLYFTYKNKKAVK